MSASESAATTAAVNTPLTRRAAATSCANRARNPASSASSILMVLTATRRPAVDRPRVHPAHRPRPEAPEQHVRPDPLGIPAAQRLQRRLRHVITFPGGGAGLLQGAKPRRHRAQYPRNRARWAGFPAALTGNDDARAPGPV